VEFVKTEFPTIRILNNHSKRGFAATVNVGARYAIEHGAEFVAVFNSDIKIQEWSIAGAVDLFAVGKNIGVVGFREIIGDSGSYSALSAPGRVAWVVTENVTGCFFMVKTSVFLKIGFFDEDYFMYGEDNDFFYRARRAGFKTISADIPVWHHGEGTIGGRPLLSTWLGYRNAVRFAVKNLGPLGVLRIIGVLFYCGCFPHQEAECRDLYLKRLRRFNPLLNLLLVAASCAWNLFYLPKTLWLRFFPLGPQS